jgi:hypothetical protein
MESFNRAKQELIATIRQLNKKSAEAYANGNNKTGNQCTDTAYEIQLLLDRLDVIVIPE